MNGVERGRARPSAVPEVPAVHAGELAGLAVRRRTPSPLLIFIAALLAPMLALVAFVAVPALTGGAAHPVAVLVTVDESSEVAADGTTLRTVTFASFEGMDVRRADIGVAVCLDVTIAGEVGAQTACGPSPVGDFPVMIDIPLRGGSPAPGVESSSLGITGTLRFVLRGEVVEVYRSP